ncbi:MAG: transglycosylase domain-containing protein [Bacteroidales bacterium]|jgi:penicillin-binding protein 1A
MENSDQTRRYLKIFWWIFGGGVVFVFLFFTMISKGLFGIMPSFEELENPTLIEATQVISEDGIPLGTFFSAQENREIIPFERISPYMIDAIVSIEDQRYYKHSGIDFKGLLRVMVKSLILRQDTGGGSTITQQLAKNLFPREDYKNPISFAIRKFKEWVIAVKLEKTFTKEEILALYLNKLSFVNNAEGIQTASWVYFNKDASQLEIHEAAMLAGMAKNPSLYNPLRFGIKNTLPRRNTVLDKMKSRGFADAATIQRAKSMDLGLDYHRVDHKVGRATYFREYLRGVLTEKRPQNAAGAAAWDASPLRGFCYKHLKADGTPYNLYRDGLRIYTTIDSRMQQYAEEAVVEHLKKDLQPTFDRELRRLKHTPFSNNATDENIATSMNSAKGWSERYRILKKEQDLSNDAIDKLFNTPTPMTIFSWKGERDTVLTPMDSIKYYKRYLRSAFMAITPQTGYVKAYVGGPDYRYFQYDQIMQGKRQVGSVFKPFVYTVAMENGVSPCFEVPNVSVSFVGNFNGVEGNSYEPQFSDTKELDGQMVTLRTGLAKSLNQIAAWVMKQYNPEAVIEVARKVGIKSPIEPVIPICVGAVDLPVYEVAGAFTAFANKGIWVEPIMVTRIEDKNGNLLATFSTHEEVAMSEETAYKMLYMMEGVTSTEGTARRLRNKYAFTNPIAGKTGTTNNYADGWFVGIVPNLIGAAWTGAEDKMVHFTNHDNGQGANMALPIWALFMKKVYADSTLNVSRDGFERPAYLSEPLNCDGMQGHETKPGKRKKSDFDDF